VASVLQSPARLLTRLNAMEEVEEEVEEEVADVPLATQTWAECVLRW